MLPARTGKNYPALEKLKILFEHFIRPTKPAPGCRLPSPIDRQRNLNFEGSAVNQDHTGSMVLAFPFYGITMSSVIPFGCLLIEEREPRFFEHIFLASILCLHSAILDEIHGRRIMRRLALPASVSLRMQTEISPHGFQDALFRQYVDAGGEIDTTLPSGDGVL